MRVVITVGGVDIEFVRPTAAGEYPWLVSTSNLLLAARAGHLQGIGAAEAANMTMELDNTARQAASLLGYCPRAPATVYDDDGTEVFTGLVQQMQFGTTLTLNLEA